MQSNEMAVSENANPILTGGAARAGNRRTHAARLHHMNGGE